MPAVPKRKVSKSRRNKRRSQQNLKVDKSIVKCKHCGALKRNHRVCPKCGAY